MMSSNPSNPQPTDSRQDPPIVIEIPKAPLSQTDLEQQTTSCPICTEDYPVSQILTPLPCKHYFCSTCLKEYLAVKINSNQVLDIPCPQAGCPEVFTDHILEGVLDTQMYTRYRDFALKKIAMKGPKQHFCPNPGCSRPFVPVQNQEFSICQCGVKICNHCDNFFHEGKSCMEAIDPDFMKYAKENGLKFCMMCKTVVARDAGCDKITCSVCDYEWCWVCGRNYETFHICAGEWDPVPPSLVANNESSFKASIKKMWNEGHRVKLICLLTLGVLLSPILLIGFIILFPLGRIEITKGKPFKSFCTIFFSLFIGLFAWIVIIVVLICYAVILIIASPFLLIGCIIGCFQKGKVTDQQQQAQQPREKKPKKRWQTRDAQNFVFRFQPPERRTAT